MNKVKFKITTNNKNWSFYTQRILFLWNEKFNEQIYFFLLAFAEFKQNG